MNSYIVASQTTRLFQTITWHFILLSSFSGLDLFKGGGLSHLSDSLDHSSASRLTISQVGLCTLSHITLIQVLGQYEVTTAKTFLRSAKLRNLHHSPACPDELQKCRDSFEKLLQPQQPRLMDIIASPPRRTQPLPTLVRNAFFAASIDPPEEVEFLSHVVEQGVRYSIRSQHEGNSGLLLPSRDGDPIPCLIEYILRTNKPQSQTFFILRQYQKANISSDPFLKYPRLRARIWSTVLHQELDVMDHRVLSEQFAKFEIDWEEKRVAVIFSLAKVRGLT